MKTKLLYSAVTFLLSITAYSQTEVELIGKTTRNFPYFHWVQNVNADDTVTIAIDGKLYPAVNGHTAKVYIVDHKTAADWQQNPSLADVTNGGAQSCVFSNTNIRQNSFKLALPNELISYNSLGIGAPYDVIIDLDNNGVLSAPDLIDGSEGPGFYRMHDLSRVGMLAVSTQDWNTDTLLTKRLWYPTNISSFDSLPLIVISHGWTHNYKYYDYIGEHLASYGYIVMSHRNDVGNGDPAGTQMASLSLIKNIDHLLANQATLFNGVLNGKINYHRMGWMGHSTGGESVVRAYTRLHNAENSSAYFTWKDVQYISSICPVAWHNGSVVNPYEVNYHQFIGGADMDVSGRPANTYTQPMTIYERGTGNKHVIYVHGASHEVFHNDSTVLEHADGPHIVNRAQLHPLIKAYTLALSEMYCKKNAAGKEFFTRSYSEYHPMNASDSIVISNEYRDAQISNKKIIDDFEINPSLTLASSGAALVSNLQNSSEIVMKDIDNSLNYTVAQPSNGMTRARFTDTPHCLVVEWNNLAELRYDLLDADKDFSKYEYLSLRVCQRTRHPFNVTLDSTINFFASLVDLSGDTSSIMIEEYGPVVQTYQRSGGWQNEFCTVRIRLDDFRVNGTNVDLSTIKHLIFTFGKTGASAMGAVGIDDIELVNGELFLTTQLKERLAEPVNDFQIYPNPSGGTMLVKLNKILSKGELEIFNLQGKRIYSEKITTVRDVRLDIPQISPGVYLIKISDGSTYSCKKIIVE